MPETNDPFIIGIPIYNEVDLLDICAVPCEIFSWLGVTWQKQGGPAVEVYLTAATYAPIRTRDGVQIMPQKTFDELPRLDLLFVPGGGLNGLVATGNDPAYTDFIQTRSSDAKYVTSVCEGALLLANAGLLHCHKATTHWAFTPCLDQFPEIDVVPGFPRYVVDGNRVTGGGISSGLDECMHIVEMLAGSDVAMEVRRTIQYFPTPVEQDLPDPPKCLIGDVYPNWPKKAPGA